jgi:homoserine dehydrogenase
VIRRVVVRDPRKQRDCALDPGKFTANYLDVVSDPEIHSVAEIMGGIHPAREWIEAALRSGKDVVTANKALLADAGAHLLSLADQLGRTIAFEAAVAGGIPIVATLRQSLTANRIDSMLGILNGTSNFILSNMSDKGTTFAEGLQLAQELGYAEADPTLDVDGSDATQKLALLAQLTFECLVDWKTIPRRGISDVEARDLEWNAQHGLVLKPLSIARSLENGAVERRLQLFTSPCLVPANSALGRARGADNAVLVQGHAVGQLMLQGLGAGRLPTASAVVADLVDLAVGRAQIAQRTAPLVAPHFSTWRQADPALARYYFRCGLSNSTDQAILIELARPLAADPSTDTMQFEADARGITLRLLTKPVGDCSLRAFQDQLVRRNWLVGPMITFPVIGLNQP